jgi:lipopolysaccharide export system protein LptA
MSDVARYLPLALLPLLAVGPAVGQRTNSNAPVDVGADRVEVQDRADRAILSGNVVATQGNMTMNSARLTVIYANSAATGTDIRQLIAAGGVTLRTPTETARSNTAIYDVPRRIITMIGGVHLTQGANRVQGGRLVLELDSHRAVMDGGGAGGGRVTGRFTVPARQGN